MRRQVLSFAVLVTPMRTRSNCVTTAIFLLAILTGSKLRAQGPPYQTDDPVPVDLHHYEFYIFGGVDGTPAEIDSTGPAFEFNWGAIPRVQLHAILPLGRCRAVEQSRLSARRRRARLRSDSPTWNWA